MSGKPPKAPKAAKAGKAPKAEKVPGGFGLWMTAIVYGLIYGAVIWFAWRSGATSGGIETAWPWLAGGGALFLVMLNNIAASGRQAA